MPGSHRRWDKMKQVVAGWWQGSRIQAHLLLSCSPCAPYHASTPDDTEWLSTDCLPANMWHTVQNLITNLAHLCNNCIHEVTDWRISCFKRGGFFFFLENQQTTKQASKDPSSGNPKAAKITVASSAESNQFWQSWAGISVGGDVKELHLVWAPAACVGCGELTKGQKYTQQRNETKDYLKKP